MRSLFIKAIRLRNSAFDLEAKVSSYTLFSFFFSQCQALRRGLKVVFKIRRPKLMLLGKGVSLQYIRHIYWGKYLKLGNHVRISALGTHGIHFGNNVSIGSFSQVITSTTLNNLGKGIKIKDNVGIGEFAYLGGAGGLTIEEDCIIGQYFSCHPENHNYTKLEDLIKNQGVSRKGIKIGRNCWIGSKVTILDGVTIGSGCVIAAGAVVTKSFGPNTILGGIPAKPIKHRS